MPSADLELAAGSAAHYEDTAYYDRTYARRTEDVEYYVEEAKRTKGAILEYGCGTGRITFPMARTGATVVGVDQSVHMLERFREHLAAEPPEVRKRIRTKRGDMREVRLRERFALVMCPFNTFLHLYTREDVERFLARVSNHLAPGGRFVFDVSMPDPDEHIRKPSRIYRTRPFVYPGVGRVRYGERFDYDRLRQILFVTSEFEPEKGDPFTMPLTHRQYYPQELEALLHYNGFTIERWVGDFDEDIDARSESHHIVITARPRRQRSRKTTG